MNLSRRLFLGGAIALAGATQVAALETTPTIYADGIHDDSPGLKAWLEGKAVRIRDGVMAYRGGAFELYDTELSISETIVITRNMRMMRCCIVARPEFKGGPLTYFGANTHSTLADCTFVLSSAPSAESAIVFDAPIKRIIQ